MLAWDLARRGVRTLVLERARFPREKVCGDYVEPRGLRILEHMGCLERLEAERPLPITRSATFVDGRCRYRGDIPFYGRSTHLPAHGYIIKREDLDAAMLESAERAGAAVRHGAAVTAVKTGPGGVEVEATYGSKTTRHRGHLVAGADGVNSVVARSQGLLVDDPRHIAVSQRTYGYAGDNVGEAAFFFDEHLFPGYGWVFPLAGNQVNIGVGILSETKRRLRIQVPALFTEFLDGVRRADPRWADLELCGPPIGGIVKTYGGIGRNVFDRGVLVGDAGSFVDPMTGEGITPAMESSLIAASVLRSGLEAGRFGVAELGAYESAYHDYFDPAMSVLELCAATLRNRHFAGPWLRALARGCELAQADPEFARTAGSPFGGLEIDLFGILGQLWLRTTEELIAVMSHLLDSGGGAWDDDQAAAIARLIEWHAAWSKSILADPMWHAHWSMDVQRAWIRVMSTLDASRADPRATGLEL